MLRDAQGLDVTTDSTETIAAINRYMHQSLSYGNDALAILKGIEADPTCAIANAYAATFYLCQESAKTRHQAAPYLQAAKMHLAKANERETLYVKAIDAWATGAIDQAIAYHEEIAQTFPRDVLSVQMGQYHYFYLGNKEGLLRIAENVLPANRENHYLYGMIAFGLEQCHRLQEAEEAGRLATQMNRNNPWAHHAVAHVMETQGRIDEGIAWMESLSDTWETCNSMLHTHNWWHVALYYLEKEDFQKVLALYDAHIWGRATKESSKDQIGAIQVLLRLELRGVNVGNHWEELTAYLTPRIHEHALPFQDLHYVYALARAGRTDWVTEMLLSMQEYAKIAKPCIQQTWTEVALPTARGMVAHARGEWERAIAQLRPTLPRLYEIGGSHAQHDLFEQVYLDAWLRAEENHQAFHLLQKRIAARRYIPSIQLGLV
ncbi:MAG: tetratricopeptide repeat protein [Coleofasciculus sp. S288]|nr:tetratricopeptide repeat protein [Coleofasciculus sp. S288]